VGAVRQGIGGARNDAPLMRACGLCWRAALAFVSVLRVSGLTGAKARFCGLAGDADKMDAPASRQMIFEN